MGYNRVRTVSYMKIIGWIVFAMVMTGTFLLFRAMIEDLVRQIRKEKKSERPKDKKRHLRLIK